MPICDEANAAALVEEKDDADEWSSGRRMVTSEETHSLYVQARLVSGCVVRKTLLSAHEGRTVATKGSNYELVAKVDGCRLLRKDVVIVCACPRWRTY